MYLCILVCNFALLSFFHCLQLKYLDVDVNDIGDEGAALLSTCIDKIDELHIFGCKLTGDGVQKLSEGISRRTTPVSYSSIIRGTLSQYYFS